MTNNLIHKWRTATKVISEMLCATKRTAEQCSLGTENDNARLDSIQAKWARDRIPGSLLLPKSYCSGILKEAEEFTSNKAMQERVMRVMFRSTWDTAYCIKTLAETFINNPNLMSARNICVMQRDLIDKIIDIPFIHRSGKSQQYLEFRCYVSAPQRMFHILSDARSPDEMPAGLEDILELFCIRLNVTQHNIDKMCTALEDILEMSHTLGKVRSEDEMPAVVKKTMRAAMNQLIATFVEKYYPDWGNWLNLSPKEQTEKLKNQLKSWTKLNHKTKLRDGLLQYIDEGFYNLDTMGFATSSIKEQCERLRFAYRLHSLYVHDSIENPIHRKQGWEESSSDYELWATLGICGFALYVAAAHYYDCAGMCDKMEHLQRIIRDNPIDGNPLYL